MANSLKNVTIPLTGNLNMNRNESLTDSSFSIFNKQNSPVTSLGYRNSETTYMIGRFIVNTDGSMSLGEYYTSGNDQAVTVFNFIMTYVV